MERSDQTRGAEPSTGPSFLTPRERRLWVWTLLTVVAIYSTLGLARTLADELRRRDLADAAFGWGFIASLLAIVALGLRTRPRGLEIGIGFGVAAVYALVLVRMAIPEEHTHLVEYGVVAILIHEALVERRRGGGNVPAPAITAIAIAAAIGAVDEVIQLALPSRVFDYADMLTNTISAALAVVSKVALSWAKDRRGGANAAPQL